jgi:hypothetical protein
VSTGEQMTENQRRELKMCRRPGRRFRQSVYSAFEFSRSAGCDELFLLSTKPFWTPDATVLKPVPDIDCGNDMPERRV